MSEWIDVNESLPDCDFGYFLVTRRYHSDGSPVHVTMSFYIKNRDMARKELPYYSRKTQGKNSVHFSEASPGIVITHWMPLPAPPKE